MSEKSLWLFIFILLYASYCFFWGVRGSRYNSDNPEEYYLANRNISSWVFFFCSYSCNICRTNSNISNKSCFS